MDFVIEPVEFIHAKGVPQDAVGEGICQPFGFKRFMPRGRVRNDYRCRSIWKLIGRDVDDQIFSRKPGVLGPGVISA